MKLVRDDAALSLTGGSVAFWSSPEVVAVEFEPPVGVAVDAPEVVSSVAVAIKGDG